MIETYNNAVSFEAQFKQRWLVANSHKFIILPKPEIEIKGLLVEINAKIEANLKAIRDFPPRTVKVHGGFAWVKKS